MTTITITSGKGGTGKTTMAANLALSLKKLGKRVLVVDGDLNMANLTLLFDLQNSPITLEDALNGEAKIRDVIYSSYDIDVVPATIELREYDLSTLREQISKLREMYDFIVIDSAAGADETTLAAIKASDDVILVLEPTKASLADAIKMKRISERDGKRVLGFVMNKIRDRKYELGEKDASIALDLPLLVSIPFSENIAETFSFRQRAPLLVRMPRSREASYFKKLAEKISGEKFEEKKENFLQRFLKRLFKF